MDAEDRHIRMCLKSGPNDTMSVHNIEYQGGQYIPLRHSKPGITYHKNEAGVVQHVLLPLPRVVANEIFEQVRIYQLKAIENFLT
jgi:hypothetical protein